MAAASGTAWRCNWRSAARPGRFWTAQIQARPALLATPNAAEQKLLDNLALLVGRKRDDAELAACLELLVENAAAPNASGVLAILAGLSQGLSETGDVAAANARRSRHRRQTEPLAAALADLPKLLERAQQVSARSRCVDRRASAGDRRPGSLRHGRPIRPISPRCWPSTSRRRCRARRPIAWPVWPTRRWPSNCLPVGTATPRPPAAFWQAPRLRSPVTTEALLAAIEAGTIVPLELDAAVRDLLVRSARRSAPRAGRQNAGRGRSRRPAAGARCNMPARSHLAADRAHGGRLVAQHCLACHQIQGRGRRLGPDLSGVGSQPKEQLLVSLLDPSRQVSPDYLAYTLVTTDGQILSGLVANETPGSVTLRRAEAADEIVPRASIELLKASGKSLMPDGFEQKLSPQDVADMLEFLRQPDAALLVVPDAPAAP